MNIRSEHAIQPFADGDRIAFFGDSITRNGEAITRTAVYYRMSFPERKVRFFNVGFSGGTTSAAHMFFMKWLAPLKATHVVLAFGVNDAGEAIVRDNAVVSAAAKKRQVEAIAGFESEYERLIDRIQASGAKVILRTPTPYDTESTGKDDKGAERIAVQPGRAEAHERIAESIRRIARKRSLPLVDDHTSFCALLASWEDVIGGDRVHPNERGQWRLADSFLTAQGFAPGEFRPFVDVAAMAGLTAWHEAAVRLADILSAEWMIVGDDALPIGEKLAKVRQWLDINEGREGTNQYVIRIAKDYLRDKPREEELRIAENEAQCQESHRVGAAMAARASTASWPGFTCGMGIGGWLTNYKRFNLLPEKWRLDITQGDLEHFDSYITEWDVENIKTMGFDHVRLGFDQIVLEEASGKWRERTFGKLREFVAWCGNHDLNVVLNLHKAIGNYCDIKEAVSLLDDEALQRRFIDLWREISRRFVDTPGVAFELLNEVRDIEPEKWNNLADRTIRAIRETDPSRWIVVGPTHWNAPNKLGLLKVWDDPKVVYTFHVYEPAEFTHQRGVLQSRQLYANMVLDYPCRDVERYRYCRRLAWGEADPYPGESEIGRSILARYMEGAFAFRRAHPDKILWCGEFGTIRHAPAASRVAWMRDVVSLCREHGILWCVWNYLSTPNDGNRFSLVDDDTRRILSPSLLRACRGKTADD